MTKYVISTAEVIKKVYIADAYTEEEALDRYLDQAPDKVEFIGELVYSIETINEYEYQKDWVDLASGRNKRHKSEWVYAHHDGRVEQQKKDHEGYPVKDYYDQ